MASFDDKIQGVLNTADATAEYDAADIQNNKVMALLSYIGILVLVPLLAAKDSKFARFHANQGLVLLIVEVVWAVVSIIITTIAAFIPFVNIIVSILMGILGFVIYVGSLILMVLGIVNAATGKAKELPLIGKIKILK